MLDSLTIILGAVAGVLLLAVLSLRVEGLLRWSYWSSRGVVHPRPIPLFGNAFRVFTLRQSLGEAYAELYNRYQLHDYLGFYQLAKPQLLIRSPQLIERILVKDFSHFTDHGLYLNEKKNWIDQSLFNLNGSKWRAVRNKMSPAFITGKLRLMLDQMALSADNMAASLQNAEKLEQEVDMKDVMSIYSMEVIASCVFGLNVKGSSEFRSMGSQILNMGAVRYLGTLVFFTLPELSKIINAKFTKDTVRDYFASIIRKTMKLRKEDPATVRNDFVQLLVQLSEKGQIELRSKDLTEQDDYLGVETVYTETFSLDEKLLTAQAYSFLTAGFDATSVTMTFACHQLALNLGVQDRLRDEIRREVELHGGFTYEALRRMTYLENCINETQRMYPLVTFLLRVCTSRCTLKTNSGSLDIDPGTPVIIPVQGLHMDSLYYPQPEIFDPDRFDKQSASSFPTYAFLPFGAGPRICIGMRFAMLQMKLGLARLVHDYEIEPSANLKLPIEMVTTSIIMMPKKKIFFRVRRIA